MNEQITPLADPEYQSPESELGTSKSTQKLRGLTGRLLASRRNAILLAVVVLLMIGGAVALTFAFSGRKSANGGSSGRHGMFTSSDFPDCGSAKAGLLKASPVSASELSTTIPMGNFAPPGHIGPTPHMYYNFLNTGTPTNIVPAKTTIHAPGDITITQITLFGNGSAIHPFNSYRIDFTVCKQVTGYFIHVVDLSDKLAAVMKPPYDSTQTSKISGTKDEHTLYQECKHKATCW